MSREKCNYTSIKEDRHVQNIPSRSKTEDNRRRKRSQQNRKACRQIYLSFYRREKYKKNRVYEDNKRKRRNRQRYEEFKARHSDKIFPDIDFDMVPYRYGYRQIYKCMVCGRILMFLCSGTKRQICGRKTCKQIYQSCCRFEKSKRNKIYEDKKRKKRNKQRYEKFKAKHSDKTFPDIDFNTVPYRYGYRKIERCKICGRTTKGVCCNRSICKRMLRTYHSYTGSLKRRKIYKSGRIAYKKPKGKLRKCKAMEILGYRSKNCDGYIHNGNWSLCQKCIEMRNQRLGVDESGYNYETYQVHI